VVGATLGTVLPDAEIAMISAVGGVLLLGVGLRILNVRAVPVANMLPSLKGLGSLGEDPCLAAQHVI
jgi:uncharacterized protein